MIDRVQQIWLSKIRNSSRLCNTYSLSFHSSIGLNPTSPPHCRPRRFYANDAPNNLHNPPQSIPQPSSNGSNQVPMQQLQQISSSNPVPSPIYSQPTPPHKPKRYRRGYIFGAAAISFTIGAIAGLTSRLAFDSGLIPEPDTPKDALLTSFIQSSAAKKPLVKSLSEDPAWHSWDAYSIFTPQEKEHRVTSGPLKGSRALGGYQRIFHNKSTGEFINIVWIGSAVLGWLATVHGGLVATLLDESMARCAISRFPIAAGVTANLNIDYRKRVTPFRFYVIRCKPVEEGSTGRKSYVRGTVETMDGIVLAEAKGLFIQSKTLESSVSLPLERSSSIGF